MSSIVECPVCEEHFRPTRAPRNQVTCPSCRRTFDLSACLPLADSDVGPPTARPSPEALIGFDQPELASKSSTDPPPLKTATIEIATEGSSGPEVHPRHYYRSKRKTTGFLIVMLLIAVFVGVVGGLLVMQLQKNIDAQNQLAARNAELESSETAIEPPAMASTPDVDTSAAPGTTQPDASTRPKNNQPRVIPQQDFFYFSKQQSNECWQMTRPHLVSLDVEGSYGRQRAVGIIIDSRGWILTSYHAIKDAWNIQVTASTKSLADLDQTQPLTDLVRGIVATDPEHDLAILAINRRFVVSFADLKISDDNRIVQGEFLMQGAPPSEEAPFGLAELKIDQRTSLEGLGPGGKAKAENYQLMSPDLTWLTFASDQPVAPGTPLFRIDGTMVAMASFSVAEQAFCLPLEPLQRLINSADGEVKPFSPPVVKTSTGNVVTVDSDSPARKLTTKLNQIGQACEAFQFFPTDAQQYAQLQEFSRSIIATFDYLADSEDEAGVALVQADLDLWEKKLGINVSTIANREPERMKTLNQLARTEITKGNKTHVVFFGILYIGGIQSSKLILKFDEMETFVSTPFDPESEPMLPDSKWLFFVETPALARHLEIRVADEGNIPTESANLLYAVGPIENR